MFFLQLQACSVLSPGTVLINTHNEDLELLKEAKILSSWTQESTLSLKRKESVPTQVQVEFKVSHTFIFLQVCVICQPNQTSWKELFLAEREGCSVELNTTTAKSWWNIPWQQPFVSRGRKREDVPLWRHNSTHKHAHSIMEANSAFIWTQRHTTTVCLSKLSLNWEV